MRKTIDHNNREIISTFLFPTSAHTKIPPNW